LATRNAKTIGAEFRYGTVVAVVAKFTQLFEQDWKTDSANHAAVFVAKWGKQRLKSHGLHMSRRHRKGDWQMLNSCFAFLILSMLGIFAAGASEIAAERNERKRIERETREKYGRTY